MKKKFSALKFIILTSLILILCLGINFFNSSEELNFKSSEAMHTYLIKIPANAGICPYLLATKSHGMLQILNNPECICPYSEYNTFLTARCKNKNSVLTLFPSFLQKRIQIIVIDNLNKKPVQKLSSNLHIAGF